MQSTAQNKWMIILCLLWFSVKLSLVKFPWMSHNTSWTCCLCLCQVGHGGNRPSVCSVAGMRPLHEGHHTPAYETEFNCDFRQSLTSCFVMCLQYDSRSRISSEAALRHPYFLSLGDNIHNLADSKTHAQHTVLLLWQFDWMIALLIMF